MNKIPVIILFLLLLGQATPGDAAPSPDWDAWQKLLEKDQLRAALDLAATYREQAETADDTANWTRALVEEVRLQSALGAGQTAAEHLLTHNWPQDPDAHTVLDLFKAQALASYLTRYSYQVREREAKTGSVGTDLSQWSIDQITDEINATYGDVWARRLDWADRGLEDMPLYLKPNTYPARIRGTLRDAVTYLWAQFVVNSGYWSPRQNNGIFRLDLELLMDGSRAPGDPAREDIHPLTRLSDLLADLHQWHLSSGRVEAAHHAQIELLGHLRNSYSNLDDQLRIRHKLETLQADLDPDLPWWAYGQWRLAVFLEQEDRLDNRIMAHYAARKGVRRHPDSVGGKYCARLVARIETPELNAEAMAQDTPGQRTILINHRNLDRAYLKAWRFDWEEPEPLQRRLMNPPDPDEIADWIEFGEADLAWTVHLPATEDYSRHKTYTELPSCPPGPYLVAVSARPEFGLENNSIVYLYLLNSDLVLQANQIESGWEFQTRTGATGEIRPGVELEILQDNRSRGGVPTTVGRLVTDQQGLAAWSTRERERVSVLAREGDNLVLVKNLWHHWRGTSNTRQKSFIYTDRSIYRPGQTVHWKAILFNSDGENFDHQVVPDRTMEIVLRDVNGQEIDRIATRTNGFGSASGQFVLPENGLLGNWNIQAAGTGNTRIRVEEYKRPTFEVAMDDLTGQPQLNQLVTLKGKATYYFGQPVSEGQLTWRVERTPTFVPWGRWRSRFTSTETVAHGEASLESDGSFSIDFTPVVDKRLAADPKASFRYTVSADVTSSGGETRSAVRSYRLGFTGVEATIACNRGLLVAGEEGHFTVRRANLDGQPQAGSGTWQLAALEQPEATPLPGDLPYEFQPRFSLTHGDTLRPRWSRVPTQLNQVRRWKDGRVIDQGSLATAPDGLSRLTLSRLEPGPYRLRYHTTDDHGRPAETAYEFLVAAATITPLNLPLVMIPEQTTVPVGGVLRVLVHSGYSGQNLHLEMVKDQRRLSHEFLVSGTSDELLEIPITENLRGGFALRVSGLRDFQDLEQVTRITVPWDNKDLRVEFLSFRDFLVPGSDELFRLRVTGPDSQAVAAGTVEVLAYMYDRTLDLFARHDPPRPRSLFRQGRHFFSSRSSLGRATHARRGFFNFDPDRPDSPTLEPDRLIWQQWVRSGRGRDTLMSLDMAPPMEVPGDAYMAKVKSGVTEHTVSSESFEKFAIDSVEDALAKQAGVVSRAGELHVRGGRSGETSIDEDLLAEPQLRENFSPTAFFIPHVQTDADGVAVIEFKVPDSVTDWSVWAHALTSDLRSGSAQNTISSRKDLMVRPYLPRFLREGDQAVIKVLVDNAGVTDLTGQVRLTLVDPVTEADVSSDFGITDPRQLEQTFSASPATSSSLTFSLTAPLQAGSVVVKVVATAANLSDGEQHLLPILPGRMHLMQSRFVTLKKVEQRELTFPDLAAQNDATRVNEQLVVTVDAQLFQGVLAALPYLVDYPYECTEQTLNRFLSSSIVSGVFAEHPTVRQMAARLSERSTRLPAWKASDPNRKMLLEETPWLARSQGGRETADQLINILDPTTAKRQQQDSLAKLVKMQSPEGGFPWMPGGRPSPYLTLYVLQGFSRAREFGVDIPLQVAGPAWQYLHRYYLQEMDRKLEDEDLSWPLVTFLNYLLSGIPEDSLQVSGFTAEERERMLDFSFRHWKQHSRLLRGQLVLTLARAGRADDARLVIDSIMDRALSDPDLGTYWAPEDRAWLWYNDSIEGHAFILRVLTELDPDDQRRHGLVQWLFLNRHLGHWKSTRATAEVIYALVHYLQQEEALGVPELVSITLGETRHDLAFDPAEYTGQDNHIIVPGPEIEPAKMSTITVAKETPGMAFASATWHFSTDQLPAEAEGDLLAVSRQYFRRYQDDDGQWLLASLTAGDVLEVGDQVEVQLEVSARQAAEFVHLRDPRGAGFEPESLNSGHGWNGGLSYYQEIRDSGANYFFDWLPTGTYTLSYRLRATLNGEFKVGPAVLQSMYAPEFTAYSAGARIGIGK